MIAPWAIKYLSPPIPFADKGRDRATGTDCWGMARLIQREQFGIEMPDWSDRYSSSYNTYEATAVIASELSSRVNEIAAADKRAGDLMLVRLRDGSFHIGVYIGDENGEDWFVHQSGYAESCRSRIGDPAFRLVGFYRWKVSE